MIIGQFSHRRRWLSNFYNTPILYKGKFTETACRSGCDELLAYQSVEHAYQAQKATNKHDHHFIAAASGAAEARRRGRMITMRGDFDSWKEWLMLQLLYHKFKDNGRLRRLLTATHPHELIHGNMHGDEFWGINRRTGAGENKLGKQLMLLRDMFRLGTEDQILNIARVKEKKVAMTRERKARRREEQQAANVGKAPAKMSLTWDEKKLLYPSVAARYKGKADVKKAAQGMRDKIRQEQIKQDTRQWLKKKHSKEW